MGDALLGLPKQRRMSCHLAQRSGASHYDWPALRDDAGASPRPGRGRFEPAHVVRVEGHRERGPLVFGSPLDAGAIQPSKLGRPRGSCRDPTRSARVR
jgi:hypothetical protein